MALSNAENNRNHYWRDPERARSRVLRNQHSRRRFVAGVKSYPCEDCGGSFRFEAMQLDHVRGEKVMGVGTMVSNGVSWPRLVAEIMKCDVVCSNCHAIRTAESRTSRWDALLERYDNVG